MTSKSKTKQSRIWHSAEYKAEALALADKVGVSAAARQLGRPESRLYDWRMKQRNAENQNAADLHYRYRWILHGM